MSDVYLSTDQVCTILAQAGVDRGVIGRVHSARLQPQNLEDNDRKFVMGVPGPENTAYLLVYRFGLGHALPKKSPLDESGPDWRPRWLSVEGPFTMDEAPAKAKELTSE